MGRHTQGKDERMSGWDLQATLGESKALEEWRKEPREFQVE